MTSSVNSQASAFIRLQASMSAVLVTMAYVIQDSPFLP